MKQFVLLKKQTRTDFFFWINLNNLAYLYKEIKDYDTAFKYISESISKINKIKHQGFLPYALDTKALIYLDWNRPEKALETINKSIELFKQGEDYRGLTDALWTKVRCLFRLNRTEDALFEYGELHKISTDQIGEIAAKKFAKNLNEEIYLLRHLPLLEEVAEFKKARVCAAMIEADGIVGKAAKILGLKTHQALSDILNKQFPELLDELGFQRRARRKSRKTKKKNSRTKNINSAETRQEGEISRLILTNKNFSFNFEVASDRFETFYFDKNLMKSFGIEAEAIVAVAPVSKLKAGMTVLVSEENKFLVGKTEFDEWAEIYFILGQQGLPTPFEEKNVIGEPIGFCPFSNAGKNTSNFPVWNYQDFDKFPFFLITILDRISKIK